MGSQSQRGNPAPKRMKKSRSEPVMISSRLREPDVGGYERANSELDPRLSDQRESEVQVRQPQRRQTYPLEARSESESDCDTEEFLRRQFGDINLPIANAQDNLPNIDAPGNRKTFGRTVKFDHSKVFYKSDTG